MNKNFYKRPVWIDARERRLRHDKYRCQECKRYGKTTAATIVHHIIPLVWCLVFNKELSTAMVNLVSLCSKCHDKMHDRYSDRLTALGLEWVRRMGKLGTDWIEKYFNTI